jgi:hypothetical protein
MTIARYLSLEVPALVLDGFLDRQSIMGTAGWQHGNIQINPN